jgi:hypothetical protein
MLGIVSECSVLKYLRLSGSSPTASFLRWANLRRVVKESGLVCVLYGKENDDKVIRKEAD